MISGFFIEDTERGLSLFFSTFKLFKQMFFEIVNIHCLLTEVLILKDQIFMQRDIGLDAS